MCTAESWSLYRGVQSLGVNGIDKVQILQALLQDLLDTEQFLSFMENTFSWVSFMVSSSCQKSCCYTCDCKSVKIPITAIESTGIRIQTLCQCYHRLIQIDRLQLFYVLVYTICLLFCCLLFPQELIERWLSLNSKFLCQLHFLAYDINLFFLTQAFVYSSCTMV